jgi:L-seryl-tRNA(Ser) seleniumtransferase
MLAQDEAALRARAERLRDAIAAAAPGLAAHLHLDAGVSYAGGGSLPSAEIASVLVAVAPPPDRRYSVDDLARRLRTGEPAVVGRIEAGRLVLDMRTVADDEVPEIAAALAVAVVSMP